MEPIIIFMLGPAIILVLLLLFWILRFFRDKKKISNARKEAAKAEKENHSRDDYLKKMVYNICQPDEYYHELLGAYDRDFDSIVEIIVVNLYPAYEAIRQKDYYSTQELKNLYLEINENLILLNATFSLDVRYQDIPRLYQYLNELLDRIDRESIFTIGNKTMSILSEIRETGKCYCFCIEVDYTEEGPVSKRKPYIIYESNIRHSVFTIVDSSEKERELLRLFKEKSRRVRIELENIAEKQKSENSNNHQRKYSNDYTHSDSTYHYKYSSRTHSDSTRQQNEQTNRKSSGAYSGNYSSSSQSGASKSNSAYQQKKNELEKFIEQMSESNEYYKYFIGCKTFDDVKKMRNSLAKEFHPDMNNYSGEGMNYINPIFDEIKKKFGNSR